MRDGRYGRRRRRLDGIVDGPFDRRRAEKPLDFLLPFSLLRNLLFFPFRAEFIGTIFALLSLLPLSSRVIFSLPLGPCFRAPLGNPQIHPQILRPE